MCMIVEENEKKFEFYELLSDVSRMKIIEKMQADDRCRFTRCSKSSQREAKSSKNYIHGLHFHAATEYATITISYNKCHEFEPNYKGFSMTFQQENGKNYKKCKKGMFMGGELWREEMDSSINVVEYATELFQNLFREFQNTIKSLTFLGGAFYGRLKNYDYGITSLNNLESLRISGAMDILHYLSKLQRPLKHIVVEGGRIASYLANCEEIYQITETVALPSVKFTYEQMLRLPAPIISIPFGDITEIQIHDFIRSWQNETEKLVTSCLWNDAQISQFSIPKLFRLLGFDDDFTRDPQVSQLKQFCFVVEHNQYAGLKGTLSCNNYFGQLSFRVTYGERRK